MKYFLYRDADWTYEEYVFSDFARHAARLAPTLDADNPDLSAFRANGGKLIIDNGWMDASLSAYGTIDYYESVLSFDASARDDVRLFIRPGATHCQAGPGPDGTDLHRGVGGLAGQRRGARSTRRPVRKSIDARTDRRRAHHLRTTERRYLRRQQRSE